MLSIIDVLPAEIWRHEIARELCIKDVCALSRVNRRLNAILCARRVLDTRIRKLVNSATDYWNLFIRLMKETDTVVLRCAVYYIDIFSSRDYRVPLVSFIFNTMTVKNLIDYIANIISQYKFTKSLNFEIAVLDLLSALFNVIDNRYMLIECINAICKKCYIDREALIWRLYSSVYFFEENTFCVGNFTPYIVMYHLIEKFHEKSKHAIILLNKLAIVKMLDIRRILDILFANHTDYTNKIMLSQYKGPSSLAYMMLNKNPEYSRLILEKYYRISTGVIEEWDNKIMSDLICEYVCKD